MAGMTMGTRRATDGGTAWLRLSPKTRNQK